MIYPFMWQNIFLPVVPHHLINVVMSPTPFLVALRRYQLEKLEESGMPLGEFVMVDVNAGTVSVRGGGDPIFPFGEKEKAVVGSYFHITKVSRAPCAVLRALFSPLPRWSVRALGLLSYPSRLRTTDPVARLAGVQVRNGTYGILRLRREMYSIYSDAQGIGSGRAQGSAKAAGSSKAAGPPSPDKETDSSWDTGMSPQSKVKAKTIKENLADFGKGVVNQGKEFGRGDNAA